MVCIGVVNHIVSGVSDSKQKTLTVFESHLPFLWPDCQFVEVTLKHLGTANVVNNPIEDDVIYKQSQFWGYLKTNVINVQ